MLSNNVKTLNVAAGKQGHEEGTNRSSFPGQEEGITMFSIVGQKPQKFDTTINVAGLAVSVWHSEVSINQPGAINSEPMLAFTPAEACALAAALQAVAVHQMEQAEGIAA